MQLQHTNGTRKIACWKIGPNLKPNPNPNPIQIHQANRNTPKPIPFCLGPTDTVKIQKRLKTLILKNLQVLIRYHPH